MIILTCSKKNVATVISSECEGLMSHGIATCFSPVKCPPGNMQRGMLHTVDYIFGTSVKIDDAEIDHIWTTERG